jgi:copper transport protein
VVSFAATGHPSASSPAAVASAIVAVHLASVLLWIGGLLAIIFGERTDEVVRSFSRSASFAIPIALITGLWQAWHLVEDPADITSTDWGRALVVKVVFVLVVISFGMFARLVLLADRGAAGLVSVRRLVAVEVIVAVLVLAATSIMVSSPPRVGSEPAVIAATLAQDDIIVNATVTPGMIGANEIHITVVTPGGSLDPVDGLEMRMTYEDGDLPPVTVDVDPLGPNHFLGTISILESGVWDLEIIVQVSPSRVVRLAMDVDV